MIFKQVPRSLRLYMERISQKKGDKAIEAWLTYLDDKGKRMPRYLVPKGMKATRDTIVASPGTSHHPNGFEAAPMGDALRILVERLNGRSG